MVWYLLQLAKELGQTLQQHPLEELMGLLEKVMINLLPLRSQTSHQVQQCSTSIQDPSPPQQPPSCKGHPSAAVSEVSEEPSGEEGCTKHIEITCSKTSLVPSPPPQLSSLAVRITRRKPGENYHVMYATVYVTHAS